VPLRTNKYEGFGVCVRWAQRWNGITTSQPVQGGIH
jgi:hypothetical protein